MLSFFLESTAEKCVYSFNQRQRLSFFLLALEHSEHFLCCVFLQWMNIVHLCLLLPGSASSSPSKPSPRVKNPSEALYSGTIRKFILCGTRTRSTCMKSKVSRARVRRVFLCCGKNVWKNRLDMRLLNFNISNRSARVGKQGLRYFTSRVVAPAMGFIIKNVNAIKTQQKIPFESRRKTFRFSYENVEFFTSPSQLSLPTSHTERESE
jgi:hypothetical protein